MSVGFVVAGMPFSSPEKLVVRPRATMLAAAYFKAARAVPGAMRAHAGQIPVIGAGSRGRQEKCSYCEQRVRNMAVSISPLAAPCQQKNDHPVCRADELKRIKARKPDRRPPVKAPRGQLALAGAEISAVIN